MLGPGELVAQAQVLRQRVSGVSGVLLDCDWCRLRTVVGEVGVGDWSDREMKNCCLAHGLVSKRVERALEQLVVETIPMPQRVAGLEWTIPLRGWMDRKEVRRPLPTGVFHTWT